jgi:hypothetical protein
VALPLEKPLREGPRLGKIVLARSNFVFLGH